MLSLFKNGEITKDIPDKHLKMDLFKAGRERYLSLEAASSENPFAGARVSMS